MSASIAAILALCEPLAIVHACHAAGAPLMVLECGANGCLLVPAAA